MAKWRVVNDIDDNRIEEIIEAAKIYVTPSGSIVFGTVDEYYEFDEVVAVFPGTAIVIKLE